MTTINAAFESKLTMEDEGVAMKILTYPLLSEEPPESTMFLVMKTSPLIQQHHAACIPASQTVNLYGIKSPSVPLMMRTPLSPSPSCIAPLQNPMDFLQQPHSKYTLTICNDLDEERIFKQFH